MTSLTALLALLGSGITAVSPVSSVSINAGVLSYLAADLAANRVTVEAHPTLPGYLLVTDTGGPTLVPQAPCVAETSRSSRCPRGGITSIRLDLGDQNDFANNKTCLGLDMYGRGEDDQLVGGCGTDVISGGPGDDIIKGGSGNDRIFGGPGDDWIDGEVGLDDQADGGTDSGGIPDPDTCFNTEKTLSCT